MNSSDIKKRLKTLQKESEDKKHERKVLATDYEKQVEIVKKSGMVAAISFLFHYVVLVSMMHNTKHVTIAGMGRFLSPFVMIVFIGSFVLFLVKGFDLFVNSDTKYSKPLADKLKINNPVAAELRRMNDTITMLDVEIDKLENELYESGESFDTDEEEKITDIKMTAGKKEKNRVVKRIVLEIPKPDTKSNVSNEIADYDVNEVKSEVQNNIADYEVNEAKHSIADNIMKESDTKNKTSNTSDKNKAKSKKNDIDDLFSGLDELALDDDEDDFESSSEMWEKDAMRRFSRY
ncbi:MAG: hypothetical protein SOV90_10275 [Lachnospiraceae bacterium]|nr:hypothetical protein [Clostridiales bacterium]MDD6292747.1 hypothetical protein [Eubacteriales bacterium]MDY2608290.1 hypothetical protein [Lachnospiraceae bacterium]